MNGDEFNRMAPAWQHVGCIRVRCVCCALAARVKIRICPGSLGVCMVKVLFVCMGNICRSPTAEGVFAHFVTEAGLVELIGTDSAGTIAYHEGEPPDERAQETALNHGIDIAHLRARQFQADDFDRFQYILAMDGENLHQLRLARPDEYQGCLELFCDFAPSRKGKDVPDPYHGGPKGFENVFRLVSEASAGLLNAILREHYPDHARGG